MRSYVPRLLLTTLMLSSWFCGAQTSASGTAPASDVPKEIPSFDLTAMDKQADPCVDFYQYACGNWTKNNPIPADKSRWGRFNELDEHNLYVLRDILGRRRLPRTPAQSSRRSATTTPPAWMRPPSRSRAPRR